MGRDSFIHPTLKRPPRRSREMSTWRGRLREISIPFPFPEKKRKHSSSSSASTLPEACSDRRWETGGEKREGWREDAPSPSFILFSCSCWLWLFFFCWQCICFTAIQIMLTQGPSLWLWSARTTVVRRHELKYRFKKNSHQGWKNG